MPEEQAVHADWPGKLYVPTGHGLFSHAAMEWLPVEGLKNPAGQGVHEDWPVEGL